MNLALIFGRTVLVAVLLVVLSCSGGGDDFEPAPGASVEEGELEALIEAAIADFDLEWVAAQPDPVPENDTGNPDCFQVESGPCQIPRSPSLSVALHGEDGIGVIVRVGLGVDELEAGDRVDSAVTSRSFTETRTVRILYENSAGLSGFAGGPCRHSADREADEGCAWEERDAPGVGDEARAMRGETLGTTGLSAVSFARENLFADIEVVRRGESDAPDGLANDIAEALDEQIKVALSQ